MKTNENFALNFSVENEYIVRCHAIVFVSEGEGYAGEQKEKLKKKRKRERERANCKICSTAYYFILMHQGTKYRYNSFKHVEKFPKQI